MKGSILITGASSGIGKETALALSSSNNLVLCGRNSQKLSTVINECANKDKHSILIIDFNEVDTIQSKLKIFLETTSIYISTFIHSAGVTIPSALKNQSFDQINTMFNTNFIAASEILSVLAKKRSLGQLQNVIFISSTASKIGEKGNVIYSATKGAIDGFTRAMARELSPVRVNSILPGIVETEMTSTYINTPEIINKYPLGPGKPKDIVNTISFLLSDQSKWITGQNLIIDGGRVLY